MRDLHCAAAATCRWWLAALLVAAAASAVPTSVTTGAELASALRDESISRITIRAAQEGLAPEPIVLQAADWASTVTIRTGRTVVVQGLSPEQPATVNYNHLVGVISVASNATLAVENTVFLGFASRHSVTSANAPAYSTTWQGPWPSILFAPDAHYSVTNVTGHPLADDCKALVEQAASQTSGRAEVINNVTVLLRGGPADTLQPVYAYGTNTQVGTMVFSYTSSISICTPDALAGGPGGGTAPALRVWPLALGVTLAGVVALAALGAAVAVVLLQLRRRRRQSEDLAASKGAHEPVRLGSGGAVVDSAQRAPPELVQAAPGLASRSSAGSPHVSGGKAGMLPPELWRLRWLGPLSDEQGRGSFGRVYKGRWTSSLVAIKVVDHLAHNEGADKAAAEEQRVAREALLSASLSHPNVIATYKICTVRAGDSSASSREAVEAGHRPAKPFPPPEDAESGRMSALLETWLVQEYADKGSLADATAAGRFRRKLDGSVDVIAILKCLNDVAAGMAYLHSAHIVHGDLKSNNVLLRSQTTDSRGYICKICDFGLSRILDADNNSHVSATSHGTASWMPPEVLDKGILTRAADVFSFALIIWSLVAGEEPWKGQSVGAVYCAVVKENARPPVPPDFPSVLLPLMQECWASDPTTRPTYLQVQQRLQTALRAAIRSSQMVKAVSS